ncbi:MULTISPECIES: hypothetical protein [unclassified Enterococcus]|uniref:hypothetical protein n=1 Tax=unclassified Enterococcus TaxID=2608891 RepID=UPI000A337A29|nr:MULTISPECIES: hypothetical protein [unclassified Enterococcus]OTO65571.1 hypothetical protein A5865_003635 [Enterococcus sp. 12E11_DIV0728]OUZ13437.1 hypothetical protein A5868_003640 [Enterococcus sp. 12F9_DIV0723]
MAMYVYKDRQRKIEFLAEDALKQDMGIRYYCPNPNCDAHMYLCGVDGLATAYFSANRRTFPHVEKCDYGSSNSFNPNNSDESLFDFERVIEDMLRPTNPTKKDKSSNAHKTGDRNLKPLRTIRQVYDMCVAHSCTQTYNNKAIGQMLLDDRSEYMYPKGVFGHKIIKAKTKTGGFYNAEKQEIYLVAPSSEKYEFVLKVSNDELFRFFRDSLYNNRDKFIIVAGKWGSYGKFNFFQTNITSKRQIKIIK